MDEPGHIDNSERAERPGKTRTWWHPLLARLLDHELAAAYSVREEVLVGKLPLRVDILLIRRETPACLRSNAKCGNDLRRSPPACCLGSRPRRDRHRHL